ncbi:glycoside hydrolase family 172 protein [Dysgonomonas termitidis]|uniref:Glycoside hydrolase family 172 protein n=1 Tax=Dysgonomonas termitidis TaxID=1516126 RepID=A0ABV9L202_9BACT
MNLLKHALLLTAGIGFIFSPATCKEHREKVVTMETLLEEMVSVEELSRFPAPCYTCHQESSYDRRSVSPGDPAWFANDDGFGIVRVDTTGGRIEKVMFDQTGPGVITRIWITTLDKRGTWRFYFDGSAEPGWIIPAYDLMRINIPSLGPGLLQPHTSYEPEGKGGNTLFLPIPYAKGCKITFEDELGVNPTPKYYGINYRKYPENTAIETFSAEVVKRAEKKIAGVDNLLLNPVPSKNGKVISDTKVLAAADSLTLELPAGENAVYEIRLSVNLQDSAGFGQLMREIIFCAQFDGKQTVWAPLSDYSGGGMGAPYVKSWYLSSDGKGNIVSRWLMPYQKSGILKLMNISSASIGVKMEANVSPLAWDGRSLYFHCSWRQETGIPVHKYDEPENCTEWNFATIEGKGVYMGDLLSLFNHAPRWYGEGDEKIWVDGDTFPSHFGTGTEDYYNSSWAPVVPFHTPFGGAPRADLDSSHGYNAFFRTRNLDGIPFREKFKFDIEMIGWQRGYSDYATTIYWYGDFNARAIGTSGIEEAARKLVPVPEDPANYKIPESIEFEALKPTRKSTSLRLEKQNAADSWDGKWSGAAHLLAPNGKAGDFVEFEFDNLKDGKYKMVVYATQANDYGTISFSVNNSPANISFDGYSSNIKHSKPINLGNFSPVMQKRLN